MINTCDVYSVVHYALCPLILQARKPKNKYRDQLALQLLHGINPEKLIKAPKSLEMPILAWGRRKRSHLVEDGKRKQNAQLQVKTARKQLGIMDYPKSAVKSL
ncbi:hypothetical protein DCOP10_1177 [Armatimonadetes bacterium DC]|nr:hypothetical protein DCOP10_1177 [Armatimonadetes bacterium DC]